MRGSKNLTAERLRIPLPILREGSIPFVKCTRPFKMSKHGSFSAVCILDGQTIQYLLVFHERIFLFAGPDKHMSVILLQPGKHGFAHGH